MDLRFLALGDSYTLGEGIAPDAGWPWQLARALRTDVIGLADPEILAVTGWTTDELAAAMDATPFAPPYALVSLSIGVNNQYRGRDADEYRREFDDLLQRAIALAGDEASRVFVVSIPDWGMTRFAREQKRDAAGIAAEIDAFNALARGETAIAGARFADVTEISRRCADRPDMFADDGLHPSAAQYALWLPKIIDAAKQCLSR
jgi:lysophospholipase L1-like esterase